MDTLLQNAEIAAEFVAYNFIVDSELMSPESRFLLNLRACSQPPSLSMASVFLDHVHVVRDGKDTIVSHGGLDRKHFDLLSVVEKPVRTWTRDDVNALKAHRQGVRALASVFFYANENVSLRIVSEKILFKGQDQSTVLHEVASKEWDRYFLTCGSILSVNGLMMQNSIYVEGETLSILSNLVKAIERRTFGAKYWEKEVRKLLEKDESLWIIFHALSFLSPAELIRLTFSSSKTLTRFSPKTLQFLDQVMQKIRKEKEQGVAA